MSRALPRWPLGTALLALAALYLFAFHDDRHRTAAWLVFALPPLVLALAHLRGGTRAAFWAGVLALFWFSHGVMVAWTGAYAGPLALLEILLALAVIAAASAPGLRARWAARAARRQG
ncbi:MAG TPA: DUF2069 domain-containing protein [Stenotrophomonas sp.]|nr:DUF2069 domain-containing protein [Stenotrophomonas sp.]